MRRGEAMRLVRYVLAATITTLGIFAGLNSADAANVVLLPLVNNVVEREDLNSIYYDRAVETVKLDQEMNVADTADIDNAVAKNVKAMTLPDKNACMAIAEAGNVDYIFAMQVDELDYNDRIVNSKNDKIEVNMRGKCVAYNAMTGKFVAKKIVEQDIQEGSLLARYDVCAHLFGNSVTREVKKALGIKKFTIAKQRIGFKGDRK